jgi:rare lipoprotein A
MAAAVMAAALLAACGSAPSRPGAPSSVPAVTPRSGPAPRPSVTVPESRPPADLSRVPDAEPRVEPIRSGGPNKPYEALGATTWPITDDRPFTERGLASWYGKKIHGRRTASGRPTNVPMTAGVTHHCRSLATCGS